jgi:hypothetical protein
MRTQESKKSRNDLTRFLNQSPPSRGNVRCTSEVESRPIMNSCDISDPRYSWTVDLHIAVFDAGKYPDSRAERRPVCIDLIQLRPAPPKRGLPSVSFSHMFTVTIPFSDAKLQLCEQKSSTIGPVQPGLPSATLNISGRTTVLDCPLGRLWSRL